MQLNFNLDQFGISILSKSTLKTGPHSYLCENKLKTNSSYKVQIVNIT